MNCSACHSPESFSRGLCRSCYDRQRRRGTTQRKNVSNLGVCTHPGCDRQSFAKNLCSLHYQRAQHPLNATWRNLRKRWPGEFPDRWNDFNNFIADVGDRPYPNAQLRRRDHTKAWSKANSGWQQPIGHSFKFDRKAYFRAWDIRKKYGLTIEQVEDMGKVQNGRCAICRGTLGNNGAKVCIDHDRTTGQVRGLLCDPCNKALGQMNDDPSRLRAAAAYLESHSHGKDDSGIGGAPCSESKISFQR